MIKFIAFFMLACWLSGGLVHAAVIVGAAAYIYAAAVNWRLVFLGGAGGLV